MEPINIPRELLWDYEQPPDDPLWRLQRIADFFPMFGRDRETVMALWKNIERLRVDHPTKILIEEYKKAWEERNEKNKG